MESDDLLGPPAAPPEFDNMEVEHRLVMKVPPMWGNFVVTIPGLKKAFLKVNKNACTGIMSSICQTHSGVEVIPKADFAIRREFDDYELVTMVRDPLKRAESTYRWVQGHDEGHVYRSGTRVPSWRLEFSQWVLALEDYPWTDPHVMPQTDLMLAEGSRWPTVFVPWDFDQLGELLGITKWRTENVSDKTITCNWTVPALELMRRRYAADFLLWEQVNRAARMAA